MNLKEIDPMKKLPLAVLAALGMMAGSVQADVISGGSFGIVEETTEITQSGNLDKFDTTLGTLTSAKIILEGSMTSTITLENTAAQDQTVQATGSVELGWGDDLGGALGLPGLFSGIFVLDVITGPQTLSPGQTASIGPLNDVDMAMFTYNDAATLGALSGGAGDMFAVTCESLSGLALQGGGGNVNSSQQTTAGCGASIEYTFDAAPPPQPMPLPAPLALLGLGRVGLGIARRRS